MPAKKEMAITFVTPREMSYLEVVERTTKKKMERIKAPTVTDALEGQLRTAKEKLYNAASSENLTAYLPLAKEMLEDQTAEDLVAAALKLFVKEPDEKPVTISEERPLPFRKESSYKGKGGSGKRPYNRDGRSGDRRRSGGNSQGGRRKSYSNSKPKNQSK